MKMSKYENDIVRRVPTPTNHCKIIEGILIYEFVKNSILINLKSIEEKDYFRSSPDSQLVLIFDRYFYLLESQAVKSWKP